MAWWEKQFAFPDNNPFLPLFVWCGRYIDDLLILWRSNVATISELSFYFNSNNLGLKF